MQRTETWIWKDTVEKTTVEFWERFRDQDANANLYRSKCFQLWIKKSKGAPFLRYSLRTFFESLKRKVFFQFDNFVKVRQNTRDDIINKHVAWRQLEVKQALKYGSGIKALVEEVLLVFWCQRVIVCSLMRPPPFEWTILPGEKGPDSQSFCGV